MNTGEVMAIATVVGSVFTMLGITGVDAGVISQAITGGISIITLITAIWTYVAHRNAVRK